MSDIGYQDGIEAFEQWFRKFAKFTDDYNKWVRDFAAWTKLPVEVQRDVDPPVPPTAPKIPLEGKNYDPAVLTTWPWPKKFFDNTMRKLKDDHDAANPNPEPTPPPEPTPDPHHGIAPRTYNRAESNNSDPLFCKNSPGVIVHPDGSFQDQFSRYDPNGKDKDGGRDRFRQVKGLRQSDNVNGQDPCTLYDGMTKWPDDSYLR